MRKINGQDMKRHNVQLVVQTIKQHAPISRTELRNKVQLTSASVIYITNALLEANIIVQEGLASGNAKGRKALMLNINPEAFYALGASINTETIMVGLADFRGTIVDYREEHIKNTILPEKAVEIVASLAGTLVERNHIDRTRLIGAGVAVPGPLDVLTGEVIMPPEMPNWKQVPLQHMLEEQLQIPICLAKESNAAAMAEYVMTETEEDDDSVAFLSLFRLGVGGGLARRDGNLLGFHGSAGEVGHIVVDPNGRKCGCGSYGCLEAMISEEALLDEARRGYKLNPDLLPDNVIDTDQLTLEELFRRSKAGDPVCLNVVKRAAAYLALVVGDVIHMVSPSRIVLGGPLVEMSPQLVELAFQHIRGRIYPRHCQNISLEISRFGSQVFLYGAITMAMNQLLPAMLEEVTNP